MPRAALLLVSCFLFAACATQSGMREATFKRATFDLGCDVAKLEAVELTSAALGGSRTFGVSGCEKRATYLVRGDGVNGYEVILNSPAQE